MRKVSMPTRTQTKKWFVDHEKFLLPIYVILLFLTVVYPHYLYQIGITLLILYKISDVASDKSTNSRVKNIEKDVSEIKQKMGL